MLRQQSHVVKDIVFVEPAKQEGLRVGQERSMIASWCRHLASQEGGRRTGKAEKTHQG
jgi:hypothetical protein